MSARLNDVYPENAYGGFTRVDGTIEFFPASKHLQMKVVSSSMLDAAAVGISKILRNIERRSEIYVALGVVSSESILIAQHMEIHF